MEIPAGQANAGTYFYHADGLGSVTDMTLQSDSSVQARYEYAPFGAATVLSGPTLAGINPYEYTGRRYDVESGLMYYRSRMYDPAARRFAQEDKWEGILFKPVTYNNKYYYVDNNPLNKSDSFGFMPEWAMKLGRLWTIYSIIWIYRSEIYKCPNNGRRILAYPLHPLSNIWITLHFDENYATEGVLIWKGDLKFPSDYLDPCRPCEWNWECRRHGVKYPCDV